MAMLKTNATTLEDGEILALLREFNSEAENILIHLAALERECQAELASIH